MQLDAVKLTSRHLSSIERVDNMETENEVRSDRPKVNISTIHGNRCVELACEQ